MDVLVKKLISRVRAEFKLRVSPYPRNQVDLAVSEYVNGASQVQANSYLCALRRAMSLNQACMEVTGGRNNTAEEEVFYASRC